MPSSCNYGGVCCLLPYVNLSSLNQLPTVLNHHKKAPCVSMAFSITAQAMAKFLWSYRTPWLLEDVHAVTHVRETFERAPFVGIHIRRGDKIWGRGIRFRHDVEVTTTVTVFFSERGRRPYNMCDNTICSPPAKFIFSKGTKVAIFSYAVVKQGTNSFSSFRSRVMLSPRNT